jgi:hypothetical protein
LSLEDIEQRSGGALIKKFKSAAGIENAARSEVPLNQYKVQFNSTKALEALKTVAVLSDSERVLHNFYTASPEHLKVARFRSTASFFSALKQAYPSHTWDPWRFNRMKILFTAQQVKDKALHRRFFEWAANELSIKELFQWYGVPIKDLYRLGGRPILRVYSESVSNALISVFPEHQWDTSLFARRKSNSQSSLSSGQSAEG